MTTQARIDANRRNARKSTGPKTDAGKARSRMNALGHGLRAAQVVLPTEDPAAFDQHLGAWVADWQPPTMARMHLVKRAAVASWRLDRCVRVETARLSKRIDEALDEWDQPRATYNARAVGRLSEDPEAAIRQLESNRGGVARLVALWREIEATAAEPGAWNDPTLHHQRYFNLLGIHTDHEDATEAVDNLWRFLLNARPDLVEPGEPGPFDPDLAEQVRDTIVKVATIAINRLGDLWDTLPDESIARARHAELMAFTPLPEDVIMLRYEGQFDREFRATLNQLIKLTQTNADLVEPEPLEAPNEPKITAVEDPTPPPAPNEPKPVEPEEAPKPAAPNEPIMVATTLTIAKPDRDREGRVWPVVTSPEGSDLPQSLPNHR